MRLLPLVFALAFCSTAGAAPVLVTLDDYTAPLLPIVEDFDDGLVNAPGLIPYDNRIVAGGIGGGKAIEPTSVRQTLDGFMNSTRLSFEFEAPWPTQVGFVTTQADIVGIVGVLTYPVNVSGSLIAPFAPNRYFQITDPDGIQAITVVMSSPPPGEPFFQIDHLQYVPEPSGAVLLLIGVCGLLTLSCRANAKKRQLATYAALGSTTADAAASAESSSAVPFVLPRRRRPSVGPPGQCDPAVDEQGAAGHVVVGGVAEEGDAAGDFFGAAQPPQRELGACG